jgi:hypothetical protein
MSLEPSNYDPIQTVFCRYLEKKNIYDESKAKLEAEEEETENIESKLERIDEDFSDNISAADELILASKDILDRDIDDNRLLSNDFDLIPNIRFKLDRTGNPTTELLDIYSKYINPLFNTNLKKGSDSRATLLNSLNSVELKRLHYYDRYIITAAVTAKFIALHNKKILMNEMKELLKFIVIKLYNCYNKINVPERIKSAFKSSLKGGAIYLSTDEDMKKIEGQIIVLYNLYITHNLSVEDLLDTYNPTPHKYVLILLNGFVGLSLTGLAGALVLSGIGIPAGAALAVGAAAGGLGMCYSNERGKIQASYCTSADTNEIIHKLYEEFGLTVSDCDNCFESITNSQLRPRYNEIETKINQFVRKVNTKYDKYNRIFEFIIENVSTILPPNKCLPIALAPPLNETDELIKSYLDILKTVVGTPSNTWAQNADFNNTIDAIIQNFPTQTCRRPTKKTELNNLISNIETRQGEDLLRYVRQILLCRDSQVANPIQSNINESSSESEGTMNPLLMPESQRNIGGKKSRKMRKRKGKTQNKRSKKRKTIRRR